jgi:sugar lactone lactonase YvrE
MRTVQFSLCPILAASVCVAGCGRGMAPAQGGDASRATSLSLVAGRLGGAGFADHTGAAARFNTPYGIVSDGAGTLYVADSENHAIRKVVVATGEVSTLAGVANQPGSNDGTGTTARFRVPFGLALDGSGLLYVSDSNNHTIRTVDLGTGVVRTFAGRAGQFGGDDGTGPSARFNNPFGITVDHGNLYVADGSNDTIRQVELATGAVVTLAGTALQYGKVDGTGAGARFNGPFGVTCDKQGNLFVTDFGNDAIRQVVIATREVSTVAGTATKPGSVDGTGTDARFNVPYGLTSDGNNLYVADTGNHTIRKMDLASRVVSTLAGATGQEGSTDGVSEARFRLPDAVALDGNGHLFVADTGNHTIRQVALSTGAVSSVAGSADQMGVQDGTGADATFYSPFGVVGDGQGNLYVADTGNHTIRKVVVSTGAVITIAGAAGQPGYQDRNGTIARFQSPTGVALDEGGNLYVADAGNHIIRQVILATGEVQTLAGAPDPDSVDAVGTVARFNGPQSVTLDGAGHLYIADTSNHTIRQLNLATREVQTVAGVAGEVDSIDAFGIDARFNTPTGVVSDRQGNLYVAEYGSSTIRRVIVATQEVQTLAGAAGEVDSIDAVGVAARFNGPQSVAIDGVGNLYVADVGNHAIRKVVTASGAVSTYVGEARIAGVSPGALPAGLNSPLAVTVVGSNLFMVDENSVLLAQ